MKLHGAALFVLMCLTTCVGNGLCAVPKQPHLLSVSFDPPTVIIDRPQVTQHLLVSGKYSDGSVRDVTRLAKFASLNQKVVIISKDGIAKPVSDGAAKIEAMVAGKKVQGAIVVKNAKLEVAYRFTTHIVPILTKAGCNGSNCHGSPVGKAGFKLSLFGYEPESDYNAIVKDQSSRRVNLKHPAQSLVLRKPTMTEPHGGGKRFEVNSPEYLLLFNYLKTGAPAPRKEDAMIERIELYPSGRVLTAPKQRQQLLVTAFYSDGTHEDVTDRTQFTSNDEGVATVTPSGTVTPIGIGEAAIMIRYGGKVSVGTVVATTLPPDKFTFHVSRFTNVIDQRVFAKLKQLRLPPSDLCTDEEFIRRVYLDIIGTLPTSDEARKFLTDTSLDKRAKLVDTLLERSEYADLQALIWADRLRSNSRFHRVGGVKAYQAWLQDCFRQNIPLDQFARALVTAKGANFDPKNGAANFWGSYDTILRPDEVAPQTSQLFLGIRIHCAQCHNHPFEKWTQNDFYSLAAVFAQVKHKNTKTAQEFELFLDPKGTVEHPVTKAVMPAHAMDSPVFTAEPSRDGHGADNVADLRVKFADWLTAPDNPFFAKAMVNRLWKQFMGRGLVEPVDDCRVTNPPTHPELLDALAKEFVGNGAASVPFDQKRIIRLICNSRAYQLSAKPNATNALDTKYYSHFIPKRLMAEVYLDAICQVTGVPETFNNYPEAKRAIQLADNRYPSSFLDTFNRTNRLVICEREEEGTMTQALNLINGVEIQKKISDKNGALEKLLQSGKSDADIIDELFLSTLSRFPTPAERARLAKQMSGAPRGEAFQDLLWALLSAREFMFNH
jgi:hypothetical protein